MRGRRLPILGSRGSTLALLLALCAGAAGACGNTVQDQPIPHNTLETLLLAPYPVYWLGRSFRGIAITEAARDPSGAFNVQYGDCQQGGQGTCVPPLRVVTSPDNSFVPGASAPHRTVPINTSAEPGGPLPARLPDTGFGATPLPAQVPPPLRPLH